MTSGIDPSKAEDSASATATTDAYTAPRLFWVGMAVFLIVMVFLGFGSTYGRQLVLGQEISGHAAAETDWIIHLHAAVFVGWMAFLLVQTTLVARNQTRVHMTLGGYVGPALGLGIVVVGSLITLESARAGISKGLFTRAEAPLITMVSWYGLLSFVVLGGLGLLYRRRPEEHKRYMMFGTIMLAFAATSRMGYLLGPWSNTIGMALMIAPLLAHDLYADGPVHTATLVGTGAAVLHLVIEYVAVRLVLG